MERMPDSSEIDEQGGKRMSLGEHLEELRRRLIYAILGLAAAMIVTMIFGKQIIGLLRFPYARVMRSMGLPPELTLMTVGAGFEIYLRVSLYAGLVVGAPWVFYQFWMFIGAGLLPREKKYVKMAIPFSATLFITGALFFFFVASIPCLRFLIGMDKWLGEDVKMLFTLPAYINFVCMLMLVFGLAFQTPLAVLLLTKTGLVTIKTLRHYRRHVVVAIAVAAAIISPSPNPLDMIILAVPMYLLFELGVVLSHVFRSKETARQDEARRAESERRSNNPGG